jgi:hypothetical protein
MKNIIVIITIILILYFYFLIANPWTLNMNKYNVYKYIDKNHSLETTLYKYEELININKFPIIIKPNMYSGHGTDVYKVDNKDELKNIIKKIKNNQEYIVQEFYNNKYEVGLLYEKNPLSEKGKIISIVLKQKYNKEWKPLSCNNIMYKKNVCSYVNREDLITKELSCVINNISKNIPNFNVGRYDIGFNDIDEFKKGKFKVFELNGNTGIDLRCNFINYNIDEKNINNILYLLRFIIVRVYYGFISLIINKYECCIILSETLKRIKLIFNANEISHILSPSF